MLGFRWMLFSDGDCMLFTGFVCFSGCFGDDTGLEIPSCNVSDLMLL